MNFLIMTRLPEIYSSQRLVQEITRLGHTATTIHPESSWSSVAPADVAIPRLGNFRYVESIKQFAINESEHPKTRVLNACHTFTTARHKKLAHLGLGDLPQPELFEHVTSFPVIVKDCISSKGEGVFLCQNKVQLEECLYKLQGREVLFQEFVPECSGSDVRAFVVGNKIVAAITRQASSVSDFRANLALGGTASKTILTSAEESLCLTAVERLGLDYAGVDFIRANRGPLILEINPCPGLEGIEKCTGVNIAQEVVLYAESLFSSRL